MESIPTRTIEMVFTTHPGRTYLLCTYPGGQRFQVDFNMGSRAGLSVSFRGLRRRAAAPRRRGSQVYDSLSVSSLRSRERSSSLVHSFSFVATMISI
ncbi:hypothetical protein THAOC_13285 [Thalassiosira oceanica]|uniref:Uncharacterized protein n=1 Tax=Thalassiosira oceanica TaxID=159749 RepID=K0SLH0_THAOC|nr:hypothetical protein THAOC_13285 [Thalassiosira oceanica]|eukprot:EJK65814.1 hypothetical protein THAOC_13285 [Thalassiosira oceanica]